MWKWIWVTFLIGCIALARWPTEAPVHASAQDSMITIVVSPHGSLPDTDVDQGGEIESPVAIVPDINISTTTPETNTAIPAFGSTENQLLLLGLLILAVLLGITLGYHLRPKEVLDHG